METNSPATQTLISPDELRQRIRDTEVTIVPEVAVEAMAMADDPDCSVDQFVAVIEKDAALVADILSVSNSGAYQVNKEIENVRHAVVLVGMSECKNLIVSASMKALSRSLPPSVEWSRDVLWRHSLQTAYLAREINREWKLGFQGEEFSAAIVHDLGRLLVALAAADVFEAVDRLTFCEPPEILDWEKEAMGTDHCELGSWFANDVGLPQTIVDVIRFHHTPLQAENQTLATLIALADDMSNHLWHEGTASGYALPDVALLPSEKMELERLEAIMDKALNQKDSD